MPRLFFTAESAKEIHAKGAEEIQDPLDQLTVRAFQNLILARVFLCGFCVHTSVVPIIIGIRLKAFYRTNALSSKSSHCLQFSFKVKNVVGELVRFIFLPQRSQRKMHAEDRRAKYQYPKLAQLTHFSLVVRFLHLNTKLSRSFGWFELS
jgi:hypothetical protein